MSSIICCFAFQAIMDFQKMHLSQEQKAREIQKNSSESVWLTKQYKIEF